MNPKDDEPHQKPARKPNPQIHIRQMDVDDIPLVFHMGEALFTARDVPTLHRTWDEYEVVNLFQTDGEYCLVAETEDDVVVGFALGTIIEKSHSWTYGYLLWMGVRPEYQQYGVARRLFRHFRLLMLEAGARIIMVDTEADNDPALRFFRKMGFNNAQQHVYLTLNVDEDRRRFEERKQAREVRQILEEHERRKNGNDD
jgi:ribosomal protein S18 acetylase RimI-like enzyme